MIDNKSEPGAWARELAARPADVHPALREHAREHAQLWARVFRIEDENRYLRHYCNKDDVAMADRARSERWLDTP
jgi:hypothetical protein